MNCSLYKKIPEKKITPTRFNGYYVSEDGEVWTEFNRYTGKIDNLRKVNQHLRGGGSEKHRYMSVNISIKNENGKTIRQIRYYTHRLIADTLIENPNNYPEVDHIDRNKQNNCVYNLRWISEYENKSSWDRRKSKKSKWITPSLKKIAPKKIHPKPPIGIFGRLCLLDG